MRFGQYMAKKDISTCELNSMCSANEYFIVSFDDHKNANKTMQFYIIDYNLKKDISQYLELRQQVRGKDYTNDDYLFTNQNDEQIKNLTRHVRRYFKRMDKPLTFPLHFLRKYAASAIKSVSDGVELSDSREHVASLMGQSVKTADKYYVFSTTKKLMQKCFDGYLLLEKIRSTCMKNLINVN
ncbi:hypothetical protein Mgra_00004598 [Meloidogyne graminicola]|uniref:Uncharacterized protein n=1 Tax=Meloidogyne graminicola TaxID=189291 RepID=A0A8S9ZSK6_9BILA|nr:hypothetical protein Mgra_00004598 [Meloidogyne graminicola]